MKMILKIETRYNIGDKILSREGCYENYNDEDTCIVKDVKYDNYEIVYLVENNDRSMEWRSEEDLARCQWVNVCRWVSV